MRSSAGPANCSEQQSIVPQYRPNVLQRVAKQCTMRSRRAQQRRPSPQQRVSKQRTMQSAWKYALHFSFEISTLRRFPLSRLRAEGSRAPQLYSELHTLLSLCWNATMIVQSRKHTKTIPKSKRNRLTMTNATTRAKIQHLAGVNTNFIPLASKTIAQQFPTERLKVNEATNQKNCIVIMSADSALIFFSDLVFQVSSLNRETVQ